MSTNTGIEWCDHTFNPWIGCTAVSPACDHCYAEALAKRYGWAKWGAGQPRKQTGAAYWRQPWRWQKEAKATGDRRRVFCASLADVFDAEVDNDWRITLFALIEATDALDWLLLTKRPNVAAKWFAEHQAPRNVWLGTTVENQAMADARIPLLLSIPGVRVRFLSCEPLLGPVDIRQWLEGEEDHGVDMSREVGSRVGACIGWRAALDWVIAGGESGPKARPSHRDWFRSLRDQCAAAGVPYFFKQWGEYLPVGQSLPGFGKVHGATAIKPGRMKLHYGGTSSQAPKHAFADHGVEFASMPDGRLIFRVGKKKAGALLDGRLHREFPT